MSKLDEIKQRMNAATPGPWASIGDWGSIYVAQEDDFTEVAWCPDHDDRPDDMTFIANAREDVPWLVTRVEELTAAAEAALEVMPALPKVPGYELRIDARKQLAEAIAQIKASMPATN
jgi:hypothetical protein